jgi:uncharacterized protein
VVVVSQAFIQKIAKQFSVDLHGVHGVRHWIKVHDNGIMLSKETGANVKVILYFAILHDCRRFSNGRDEKHGPRAAAYARKHRDEINLTNEEFELLDEALTTHTNGCGYNADITVQTCLDADRLDIGRVGAIVDPAQLYTKSAIDKADKTRQELFGWKNRTPISKLRQRVMI